VVVLSMAGLVNVGSPTVHGHRTSDNLVLITLDGAREPRKCLGDWISMC
jgi:hypothetical protein